MEKTPEALAIQAALQKKVEGYLAEPWTIRMEPYQVVPNVYYVGNKWVACYLLNTQKGLVLIDAGYRETLYLLFDSIRKVGFDPAQIKTLLISHGHFDHCGAAAQVQHHSGCELYFPEGDAFFLTERRDLIVYEERVAPFRIDHYYDYSQELDFGDMRIRPVQTPGHTPGCTSLLVSVDTGEETLLLGMHGGLGLNGLSKAELEENGLPLHLQQDYLNSLKQIREEPVDIVIPSHISHYPGDYLGMVAQNDGSGKSLRVPGTWAKMMDDRIRQIEEVITRDWPENN